MFIILFRIEKCISFKLLKLFIGTINNILFVQQTINTGLVFIYTISIGTVSVPIVIFWHGLSVLCQRIWDGN